MHSSRLENQHSFPFPTRHKASAGSVPDTMPSNPRLKKRAADAAVVKGSLLAERDDDETTTREKTTTTSTTTTKNEHNFKGVYSSGQHWRAIICRGKDKHALGQYKTPREAAMAFDRASVVLGGKTKNFEESTYEAKALERFRASSYTIEDLKKEYGMGAVAKMVSRYKGVSFDKRSGKFKAEISHDRVRHSLGCYDDEASAAEAYDYAVLVAKGPDAKTNFDSSRYDVGTLEKLRQHRGDISKFRESLTNVKTRRGGGKSTSKYEGVHKYEHHWRNGEITVRWRAEITLNSKKTHIGYFETEEEAARQVAKRRADDKS